jgi:hypothetical protein
VLELGTAGGERRPSSVVVMAAARAVGAIVLADELRLLKG